jgi:hypothetical protein
MVHANSARCMVEGMIRFRGSKVESLYEIRTSRCNKTERSRWILRVTNVLIVKSYINKVHFLPDKRSATTLVMPLCVAHLAMNSTD